MFTEAESSYRKLVQEADALRNASPHIPEWSAVAVSARSGLASMLYELGRTGDSTEVLREAAQIPIVENWRDLANLERCQYFGDALTDLGSLQVAVGLVGEPDITIAQCGELRKHLLAANPQSWDYRFGFASAVALRGQQKMWWGGEDTIALQALQEAVGPVRNFVSAGFLR